MGAFYIGQRVRVVAADRQPEYIGMTGTVIELRVMAAAAAPVSGMTEGLRARMDDGKTKRGPYDCFEPILPPGLESDAEIDALYEPEPIHVSEAA